MNVAGIPTRTLSPTQDGDLEVIDQRRLPHQLVRERLRTSEEVVEAIAGMHVRGAPLIGVVGAWGVVFAAREAAASVDPVAEFAARCARVRAARPTAVNLAWAVDRTIGILQGLAPSDWEEAARTEALAIAEEDVAMCASIGRHGAEKLHAIAATLPGGRPLRILTHCNAGWLACVDWGTATAPIYAAHRAGLPVEVWVDETRPRNQGARLTAWELHQEGVPCKVIADNAGGHLMQHGLVDVVIVGADRVARNGDAANKIGTYLKALAARDTKVPFWVAFPGSTLDPKLAVGVRDIPIEERSADEVLWVEGLDRTGAWSEVLVPPAGVGAANPGFDVTPARLIDWLLTERGACRASEEGLRSLFPEVVR